MTGNFDTYGALRLRDEIREHLEAGRACIVVEAAGVTGLNSTAVGILLASSKSLRARGGDLRLAALPAEHLETLSILGALKVLRTFPDVASAERSFDES